MLRIAARHLHDLGSDHHDIGASILAAGAALGAYRQRELVRSAPIISRLTEHRSRHLQ